MDRLPAIDEHIRFVAASADRTWSALTAVLAATFRRVPSTVAWLWDLEQPARAGDWSDPAPGATIPGFVVVRSDRPMMLTLRGRHRFSRYELRFVLEAAGPGQVALHAVSAAEFPGPLGRVYRMLVIGSGGHVVAVRRLLAHVARRAEQ